MESGNNRVGMVVLVFMLALPVCAWAQQNIQFTQYIFNAVSVNPAYAGYKEQWFGQIGLRSQWVGLDGAPRTGTVSVDGLLDAPGKKRHGLGVQLLADGLGAQTATSAYVNYAFRLQLDDADSRRLSFGVAAGATQYSLDGTKLQPTHGEDQVIPRYRINNFVPDVRFGMYYYDRHWYAGLSVMDLLSGDQSNNIFRWDNTTVDNIRRRRHVYLIAGGLVDFDDGLKLRPSLLIKEDFRGPTSLDMNMMFIFGERFWIGGGWRTGITVFERDYNRQTNNSLSKQNAVSAVTQVYLTDQLRVGYSYDHLVSRLANVQHGTHELTLGFSFGPAQRRMLNPRFF